MRTFNLLFFIVIIAGGGCTNSNPETRDDITRNNSGSAISRDSISVAEEHLISPIAAEKYAVSSYSLCDDEHGILLNRDTMSKYGKYNPYHISEITHDDTTVIHFDFITDCCATFSGEVGLERDTLYLGYYFDRDTMRLCDCYCDYRMTYRVNKADLKWSAMKIVHGRLRRN